jgi:hypothetical protein
MILTSAKTYSVKSHVLFNILIKRNIRSNFAHTFCEKAVFLFTNCRYSFFDIFSFRGKSIQSGIQYVFSRYSVLGAKVFSQVFSFRG